MSSMYDYRCENKAAKKKFDCSECGYGIFVGDVYFEIDENIICEDCMEEFKRECEY